MPHPFGIAARQIVVDRDNMHTFSGQGIQVGRQGRCQRFALTGFHLGNFAFMQNDSADQLDIKMSHIQRSHGGFPYSGKRFRQDIIKGFPLIDALFEHRRLRFELIIAHRLNFRFQRIDPLHRGLQSL